MDDHPEPTAVTPEVIYRRLGQVEHLLSALLEKQERSTDIIAEKVELATAKIGDQVAAFRSEAFDSWIDKPEEGQSR
jgi:hypothetical protein